MLRHDTNLRREWQEVVFQWLFYDIEMDYLNETNIDTRWFIYSYYYLIMCVVEGEDGG